VVRVFYEPKFQKLVSKIKNAAVKEKVIKQIEKIITNPEIGKPMRYERFGSRELYIPPFRLSYLYEKNENKIIFLDLYHKDEQ
jgi:mRNA-degrading endonuclease RelE of RelBE toxin-antitoxin system